MTPTFVKRAPRPGTPPGERPFPAAPALLHEFFEQAARRWPQRTAIDIPPGSDRPERRLVTYAALRQQSDALAHVLHDYVTRKDCVVAILLPRASECLYLAQLAVLKAGAAYTCIDPAFPDEQVADILEDARAVAVLTDDAGLVRVRRVQAGARGIVNVGAWRQQLRRPIDPPARPSWLTPDCL